MATLTITPTSTVPNATLDFTVTGLSAKKRVRAKWLDATSASATGRASSDGSWGKQGLSVGSVEFPNGRVLIIEQIISGTTWTEQVRGIVIIKKPVVVDTTPPVISNIATSSITQNSVNFTWHTNEFSQGQVQYGTTTTYGSTTTKETSFNYQDHIQGATGLASGTLYHFRIWAADAAGNQTYSPDNTFTTASAGTVVTDLQAAINATPVGGTLDVTGQGPYKQQILITKSITLIGARIDATNLGIPLQVGAMRVTGSDVTIKNAEIWGSGGAGFNATGGASRLLIQDSRFHDNIQEGYNVADVYDVTFLRCRIDHNNVARTVDYGWEAGGGKGRGTNLQFIDCEADHNGGPGIWYDQYYAPGTPESQKQLNTGAVVRGCRVHDNIGPGIMYEVSHGAVIENNICWNNGFDGIRTAWWPWHPGILVSSSGNVTVRNNTVAWNHGGITVVSQGRDDRPSDAATNVQVYSNNILMLYDEIANSWNEDWAGPLLTNTTNGGNNNKYWWAAAEDGHWRFGWGSGYSSLASFNGTRGDEGGRYLTTAEKDALLAQYNIPPSP